VREEREGDDSREEEGESGGFPTMYVFDFPLVPPPTPRLREEGKVSLKGERCREGGR
jgi:hypothetical protein